MLRRILSRKGPDNLYSKHEQVENIEISTKMSAKKFDRNFAREFNGKIKRKLELLLWNLVAKLKREFGVAM